MSSEIISIDASAGGNIVNLKRSRIIREVEYVPGKEFKVKVVGKANSPQQAFTARKELKMTQDLANKIESVPKNIRNAILRASIERGLEDYEEYGIDLLNQNKDN